MIYRKIDIFRLQMSLFRSFAFLGHEFYRNRVNSLEKVDLLYAEAQLFVQIPQAFVKSTDISLFDDGGSYHQSSYNIWLIFLEEAETWNWWSIIRHIVAAATLRIFVTLILLHAGQSLRHHFGGGSSSPPHFQVFGR